MQNVSHKAVEASLWIDSVIPLVPFFIVFYMLGYFYPFAYAIKEKSNNRFNLAMVHYTGILSISFLIFKFFPIRMVKTFALDSDFFSRLTYSQQTLDTHFNNFPSLHVSLNVFTYLISRNFLPPLGKKIFLVLTILITMSTMLVKQHLFVDVIGGISLASVAYYSFKRINHVKTNKIKVVTVINVFLVLALCLTQQKFISIMIRSLENYLQAM